ncbi:hypothetical protein GCM10008955_37170 [Deinococcus malanensis]|uniref:Uncharacterized protein n=1 Tax=Deinococcus malanensis TaxID=1706855 RepID=A0ABQ2F0Y4_9DEIO|nr:hypothetical protein [Deinococcus malanensis]GGK39920.1 hypothetical protein GCM10008955_37170 [Deinococcus malanensis]
MHKYPANARRHYERLKRFPEGLLVMGDALCSFNPTYAQGMTVASLEGLALRDALRAPATSTPLWRRYFRAAARAVDLPWSLVTGGDSSYPESNWSQPLAARLTGRYFTMVQRTAVHDGAVFAMFIKVQNLVEPPAAFFKPAFVLRVLRVARQQLPQPPPAGAVARAT